MLLLYCKYSIPCYCLLYGSYCWWMHKNVFLDEKSGSLRKKLTFSIKKTVGIGITIKEEVEESGRSGIYVDKIIRGLDSAKVC